MREKIFLVVEDLKDIASWYGPEILNTLLFMVVLACLYKLGWS